MRRTTYFYLLCREARHLRQNLLLAVQPGICLLQADIGVNESLVFSVEVRNACF